MRLLSLNACCADYTDDRRDSTGLAIELSQDEASSDVKYKVAIDVSWIKLEDVSHYWRNLMVALARIIADPLMLSAQFVFGFHSEESMKDFAQRVLSKAPSLFRFATIRYSLWSAPLASNMYGGVGWYKAALDTVKPKGMFIVCVSPTH